MFPIFIKTIEIIFFRLFRFLVSLCKPYLLKPYLLKPSSSKPLKSYFVLVYLCLPYLSKPLISYSSGYSGSSGSSDSSLNSVFLTSSNIFNFSGYFFFHNMYCMRKFIVNSNFFYFYIFYFLF